MAAAWPTPFEGGCGCGALRYRINRSPMYTHCCNCEWCQRETGSAFAVNLMVESDQISLLPGRNGHPHSSLTNDNSVIKPMLILMPTASGQGQLLARCPRCFVVAWSHYSSAGPSISFIRGGTLDKVSVDGTSIKDLLRPDMFIHTKWKQPWVVYPTSAVETGKVAAESYDPKDHWPDDVMARYSATRDKTNEWIERGRHWDELGDVVELR